MTPRNHLDDNVSLRAPDGVNKGGASSPIAVLGSLHLDILVHAPGRPIKGETPWGYKAGGKGTNQAVAAAQFGARVSMVGRVGNDDFGKRLLNHLKAAGVDAERPYRP